MIRHPFIVALSVLRAAKPELSEELFRTDDLMVREIISLWDRKKLSIWPDLARAVICKIALSSFHNAEDQQRFLDWACSEAGHWWLALRSCEVTPYRLRELANDFFAHRGRP